MSSANKKTQLVVIFITVFIYLLGFGIIIPILPILSRDFGATAFETGLLMSIYSLAQFLFAPFWGRLSDRKGRKPILLFCLLGEGLSYIIFALSRDLYLLFLARAMAGFFGGSISTASAYISDITPQNERSKGMALIGVAFGLGFVFGPTIGGLLTQLGSQLSSEPFFNTSFASFFVAGICGLTFLFGYFKLEESLKEKNINHDRKNRFLVIFEKLKIPIVNKLIVIFFLLSFAMSSMEATLILFMGSKFNWGVKEVSFGFGYIGLMMIFAQGFLVRRLIPKYGERVVLTIGSICFFSGLGLIAVADSISFMAICMTLLALGNGLSSPSVLGSISLLTESTEQGGTMGVTQSLSSLGRILGPALGGWLFYKSTQTSPFIFSSLLGMISFIVLLSIYSKIPVKGKHHEPT
ncbi:MAG: MFS transporter [Deltaproteobacteria bacterium]|jgi:DHA1 family tetracycline resistance protein-like MFS transporter|nr:MFS transporter [Deltaproteobacteria bacterium]